MIKRWFIGFLFTLFLVGCSTSPKYEKLEVKESQVVYQNVPTDLSEPCTPSKKPPVKEEFLKLKPHEREAVLTVYTNDLLGDLNNCNKRFEKIRNLPAGQ